MKKLASLLLVAMLAATMIAPVAAADTTDVLMGTPVVDGELDEIYTQSATQTLGNPAFYKWDWDGDVDMSATSYFLWDDDYLYVAVVVTDSDVISIGADIYADNPTNWQADATELWFDEGAGKWKTHGEGTGLTFFVQNVDGTPSFESADCKYATSETADGYIVEYAMPVANLEVGGTINMSMQVNDMVTHDSHPGTGYASGSQAADITLTFSDEEVSYPEPETEAPAETEAEVVDAAVEAPAAPQTFDAGIVAAVAAIVSAAGYAVSKKR